MSEHFLAAEEQYKTPALLAHCERSLSARHRWVLERVLPSQQREGELSAVIRAQSTLQITAKRLQGCPRCGVQCALRSKSASRHGGGKGYFLGETRLPRAPRTSIKVLPLGLIALMCNEDVQKWSNHQQTLNRANR